MRTALATESSDELSVELTFLGEHHENGLQKHQPSQYALHDDSVRQLNNKSSKLVLKAAQK